ncbi:MAG: site-2 protease family protein [Eubacteriales bacterium]|nr:site-2 protease family protein [Eubacteriales bacterium]
MSIINSLLSDPGGYLLNLLYSLPAILIALSFHEWAHAFAAYKLGDPTARNLGRMTVNPLHHIDTLGFLMLILVRFGWAKPVPVNMRNFKKPRRDDIIVSLAGITTNFLLAIVSMLVIYVFGVLGGSNAAIANILYYFLTINLGLMLFNLIPLPPLDGSHVVESLLIRKVGPKPFYWLSRYGGIILIVLLITGVLTGILSAAMNWIMFGLSSLFDSIFQFPGFAYLFAVMVGGV